MNQAVTIETRRKILLSLEGLRDLLQPQTPVTRFNRHRCLTLRRQQRFYRLVAGPGKTRLQTFKTYEPALLSPRHRSTQSGQRHVIYVLCHRPCRPLCLFRATQQQAYGNCYRLSEKPLDTMPVHDRNATDRRSMGYSVWSGPCIEFSCNLLFDSKRPQDKEHLFCCFTRGQIDRTLPPLAQHPLTNGKVGAMSKKIKANMTPRIYYGHSETLKAQLYHYLLNYNFKLELRAIKRNTLPLNPPPMVAQETRHFVVNLNQLTAGTNSKNKKCLILLPYTENAYLVIYSNLLDLKFHSMRFDNKKI